MDTISHTEENYLKAIFKIVERESKPANTNAISAEMNTAAHRQRQSTRHPSHSQAPPVGGFSGGKTAIFLG
jgi:hypothetical protein